MSLLSSAGVEFLLRWLHFLAGITWIGLLYCFNFVQGPFFAEADAATKSQATQKLVPRALWWFRWSAAVTFLSGALIIGKRLGDARGHRRVVQSVGRGDPDGGAVRDPDALQRVARDLAQPEDRDRVRGGGRHGRPGESGCGGGRASRVPRVAHQRCLLGPDAFLHGRREPHATQPDYSPHGVLDRRVGRGRAG